MSFAVGSNTLSQGLFQNFPGIIDEANAFLGRSDPKGLARLVVEVNDEDLTKEIQNLIRNKSHELCQKELFKEAEAFVALIRSSIMRSTELEYIACMACLNMNYIYAIDLMYKIPDLDIKINLTEKILNSLVNAELYDDEFYEIASTLKPQTLYGRITSAVSFLFEEDYLVVKKVSGCHYCMPWI